MSRRIGICDNCDEPRNEHHDLIRCSNILAYKIDLKRVIGRPIEIPLDEKFKNLYIYGINDPRFYEVKP